MFPWSWCVCVGVVLLFLAVQSEAGCRESNLCCTGKNVTCKAKGGRVNSIDSRACFCDEYCLNLGDCCDDYAEYCRAVDCELGPWKANGRCNKECGRGHVKYTRDTLVHPRNGGKKCDVTAKYTVCYGRNCKRPRHTPGHHDARGLLAHRTASSNHRNDLDYQYRRHGNPEGETGTIIPAMYGTWRKNKLYNPFQDIRRNLFNHYSANQIIHRPPYCSKFEITRTRDACQRSLGGIAWSRGLIKGTTMCVECQQYAMKHKLGVRCKGHGIYLKETSWSAYTVPGCHGKWIMKTKHEECTCNPSSGASFIFV